MLTQLELHASLEDPVLHSMGFLNEIIGKFPGAISFAPGAPNPTHLTHIDTNAYIGRYVQYLSQSRGLKEEEIHRHLYQYGPSSGLINELIATAIQQDKNIHVAPDEIVVTVGAQEAMLLALRALFRSSQNKLAVVNPCYVGILGAARLLDIDCLAINETNQGVDLEQLDRVCTQAHLNHAPVRSLYVAPDFSNPAGTVLSLAMRQRLLALAERYDFFIIEDNAYGFTALPGEEIPSLKALDKNERVIFIATFSKVCLPGARVGYMIADQTIQHADGLKTKLSNELANLKSMVTVNTSPICQAIIGGMLLEYGGSFLSLERERSAFYQNNLQLLLSHLSCLLPQQEMLQAGVSWNKPSGGFFVRVRLPVPVDEALLAFSAEQHGVIWTPMSSFYMNGAGEHELRLSCSYLTPEVIEAGVTQFASFISAVLLQLKRG